MAGISVRSNACAGIALALTTMVIALPAHADVIEVADDGSTVVRGGSGEVRWSGEDIASDDVALELPADLTIPDNAVAATRQVPLAYTVSVDRIAARYGISPALLEAVVWQESRWHANARSRVGAVGLAQLMPATARALGIDARDPIANLTGGAQYLRAQLDRFDGNLEKALAAYNAGPTRVQKAGGVPSIRETQGYVAAILGRLSSSPSGE